ncbi:hypothetical protein [Microbacterium sp. cx-59]|uniref:hypothetical protein n=1 Tax=Microbacterium sp. cx-59 TaxID=2891207 RepID=UPI001E5A224D|nr:hypothetical protein [Microbacterium sp. cx-59]MCC4908896.1 hypothetical protein [Microbacterium sp. cx-59]
MLTRDDQTVIDCLDVVDSIASVHLEHIGFKDVGVPLDTLRELHSRIKAQGATSYLEVVSTTKEDALASARMAVELGVDVLLGGTWADDILPILEGTGIAYLPFPGTPIGHPTVLYGDDAEIERHTAAYSAAGCAGVDLLAYRAADADPVDLVRAARRGTAGTVVVAGSIRNVAQIEEIREAGADAFTVGAAAMTGDFAPRSGSLVAQLRAILEAAK